MESQRTLVIGLMIFVLMGGIGGMLGALATNEPDAADNAAPDGASAAEEVATHPDVIRAREEAEEAQRQRELALRAVTALREEAGFRRDALAPFGTARGTQAFQQRVTRATSDARNRRERCLELLRRFPMATRPNTDPADVIDRLERGLAGVRDADGTPMTLTPFERARLRELLIELAAE